MIYDPDLPFGGYGSDCGNLWLQRARAADHAVDPRCIPPVFIDFPDLADCRECDMCGGCETHGICLTDMGHIEWRMVFASPGEPVCGAVGGQHGRRYVCALPADHDRDWHMARTGDGWEVAERCAGCGSPDVVYRNYLGTPLCCPCAACCPAPEPLPHPERSET